MTSYQVGNLLHSYSNVPFSNETFFANVSSRQQQTSDDRYEAKQPFEEFFDYKIFEKRAFQISGLMKPDNFAQVRKLFVKV